MIQETDIIKATQKAFKDDIYGSKNIPFMILDIIKGDKWRSRKIKNLKDKEYNYFPEFVEDALPYGLDTCWEEVQRLIKPYPDVELAVANLLGGKHGGDRKSFSYKLHQKENKVKKTKRQMDLEQLSIYRPDLLKKVSNKEMPLTRAMIEGGFRTKRIVVAPEPKKVAKVLIERFSIEERKLIADLLNSSL